MIPQACQDEDCIDQTDSHKIPRLDVLMLERFRYTDGAVSSKLNSIRAAPSSLLKGKYAVDPSTFSSRIHAKSYECNDNMIKVGLDPLKSDRTSPWMLILGSAPSAASLRMQQYYGHPQNHFWAVVERVFHLKSAFMNLSYKERVHELVEKGVCVWDVCQTFIRSGSSDSKLECLKINPLASFLEEHTSIQTVALNGQTAAKLFDRYVVKRGGLPISRRIRIVVMPSTSPANAMRNAVETKAEIWKKVLTFRLNSID